jgi:topoisomerase-4 subunit A
VVPEDEVVAQTRTGKQVLNVKDGVTARSRPVAQTEDDAVAVVGENRKLLVFRAGRASRDGRGKGVRLQKYKDGGPVGCQRTFPLAEGLSWLDPAGRTRTEPTSPSGRQNAPRAGRMAPRGFPRDNRFT